MAIPRTALHYGVLRLIYVSVALMDIVFMSSKKIMIFLILSESEAMTGECRQVLMQIHYFMAR